MSDRRQTPGGARQRDPGDAAPPGVAGPDDDCGDFAPGRERDPGDAVPPGVAPLEPPEPTEEDLRVLEKLRELPKQRGGG